MDNYNFLYTHNELKTLRETTIQHENRLSAEGKISSKFTTDLPVMVNNLFTFI